MRLKRASGAHNLLRITASICARKMRVLLAVFQRLRLQAVYDSGHVRKVSHIVYYMAIYCRVYYAGDFRLPVLKLNTPPQVEVIPSNAMCNSCACLGKAFVKISAVICAVGKYWSVITPFWT